MKTSSFRPPSTKLIHSIMMGVFALISISISIVQHYPIISGVAFAAFVTCHVAASMNVATLVKIVIGIAANAIWIALVLHHVSELPIQFVHILCSLNVFGEMANIAHNQKKRTERGMT